jgi:hypothetical protein
MSRNPELESWLDKDAVQEPDKTPDEVEAEEQWLVEVLARMEKGEGHEPQTGKREMA